MKELLGAGKLLTTEVILKDSERIVYLMEKTVIVQFLQSIRLLIRKRLKLKCNQLLNCMYKVLVYEIFTDCRC